jgi:hypothetical protein
MPLSGFLKMNTFVNDFSNSIMEKQPLLTHDQLVDWLIYHRPLEDTSSDNYPFEATYHSSVYSMWNMRAAASTPWDAYHKLAKHIVYTYPHVHREITDLYWYWTI